MVESTYPHPKAPSEVVVETQLTNNARAKGNMCNTIMASIGLGSTTPTLYRGGEGRHIGIDAHMEAQLINTPSSLKALGKIAITPKQGKYWELRNKSPLGGK